MVLQDRLEKEKGFAKNAVESYVYDMRGRLYDKLQKYITEEVTYCVMLQLSHRKHSKLFFLLCFNEVDHTEEREGKENNSADSP